MMIPNLRAIGILGTSRRRRRWRTSPWRIPTAPVGLSPSEALEPADASRPIEMSLVETVTVAMMDAIQRTHVAQLAAFSMCHNCAPALGKECPRRSPLRARPRAALQANSPGRHLDLAALLLLINSFRYAATDLYRDLSSGMNLVGAYRLVRDALAAQ